MFLPRKERVQRLKSCCRSPARAYLSPTRFTRISFVCDIIISTMDQIFANKKILWVEDDVFLSGLIGQRFGGLGAVLFGANNGKEALEIAKMEKPDVILLDILLPGIGGFEILKELKDSSETKDIPVIILSNLSQKSDIEKGKELGAVSFLVKATVDLDEIVNEVKKVLKIN